MNEADICRTYVLPKLKSAGWEDDFISEQMVLTAGPSGSYELQFAGGEELRPFFGWTLISCLKGTLSLSEANGMPSVL